MATSSLNPVLEGYLTKAELAEALGVSERTLDRWAAQGKGAARTRCGKAVYYSRARVVKWLESNTHEMPREAAQL